MDDNTTLIIDKINGVEKKVDRLFQKTDKIVEEQIRQDERMKVINTDNKLNKKIFVITPVTIIICFAITFVLNFLKG